MPVQKYQMLDFFRFFAASFVVLYHLNIGMQLGFEKSFPGILNFKYFVDFFFVLSGFVIAINYWGKLTSPKEYVRFLGRRIARIYPLHLLTLLLFAVAGNLSLSKGFSFDRPEYFSWRWFLENLLLVQAWGFVPHRTFNGPAWSISAELFVYLLFPLFIWLATRFSMWRNAVLIIVCVALMIMIRDIGGYEPWHIATNQAGMLRAVPTFFAGVLIARTVVSGTMDSFPVAWLVALASIVITFVSMVFASPAELIIASFVPLVLFTAVAERQSRTFARFARIGDLLGNASYALYMIHMGLIAAVTVIARKTVGLEGSTGLAIAAGTYLGACLLSVLVYHWFENPARLAIQNVLEKPKAAMPLPLGQNSVVA